jgi:uncharacterized membrane protein YeaQ/YmgE (transglycosylase-associated protein family)
MADVLASMDWPSFWWGVSATAVLGVIGALIAGAIGEMLS